MKIATVTDDGITLSKHFGRAPYFVVFTVEDGKITDKETLDRAGNTCSGHDQPGHGGQSAGGHAGVDHHRTMADPIKGSQALIAGGMGFGAYNGLKSSGIEPYITDVENIEDAVRLYISGDLVNLMEKLH